MPEPHFGLAHSMGGAIALNAAYETWLPFRRLVTTTPMIALCIIKRTRASAFVARILRFLGMGKACSCPAAARRRSPPCRSRATG